MIARCSRCRYCTLAGLPEVPRAQMTSEHMGECRRYPPTPEDNGTVSYRYGFWPLVWPYDWCGAFEPADAEEPRRASQ